MLTPRLTLARRVTAALDASPSRIPVLVGGCGSGRTTLLRQLRERAGRQAVQYIDVERTATTPERFLRASDLTNSCGETNNPEWKTLAYDDTSGSIVVPKGSVGFRWGEKGKWNLE